MLEHRARHPGDPADTAPRPRRDGAGWLPDVRMPGQHEDEVQPGEDIGPADPAADVFAGSDTVAATGSSPTGGGGMAPGGVLLAVRHRLPPVVRGGRLALSGRAGRALLVVALLSVALAGAVTWRARAQVQTARVAAASAGASTVSDSSTGTTVSLPATPAAAAPTTASTIVVDVAGKVARPGVVTLPSGSRVVDALRRAGGALPRVDLSSVDLARVLADGEQVLVGVPGAGVTGGGAGPGTGTGATASASPSAPVSLNTATAEELDALPGVGPVLAQRIVTWRGAHGGFTSVSQLQEIPGLGGKKFASLSPLVRL